MTSSLARRVRTTTTTSRRIAEYHTMVATSANVVQSDGKDGIAAPRSRVRKEERLALPSHACSIASLERMRQVISTAAALLDLYVVDLGSRWALREELAAVCAAAGIGRRQSKPLGGQTTPVSARRTHN